MVAGLLQRTSFKFPASTAEAGRDGLVSRYNGHVSLHNAALNNMLPINSTDEPPVRHSSFLTHSTYISINVYGSSSVLMYILANDSGTHAGGTF